ncbi:hypothetical protein [Actinomadura chokoriensis]|uniref:Uncharacterized protein n=1 Tax=Actinomadura chokoriensis TaxID=454156 RepID=A0ABV4RBB4_9ACTN
MADREPGLPEQLEAYKALMDAIVPESAYWLMGKREDPDRVQELADAVTDPSSILPTDQDEQDEPA